jgi:hypothetical protein
MRSVHNSIKCGIDHKQTKTLRPEKLVKLQEAKGKCISIFLEAILQ